MALTPAAHDPNRQNQLRDKENNPINWGDFRHAPEKRHQRQKDQQRRAEK